MARQFHKIYKFEVKNGVCVIKVGYAYPLLSMSPGQGYSSTWKGQKDICMKTKMVEFGKASVGSGVTQNSSFSQTHRNSNNVQYWNQI